MRPSCSPPIGRPRRSWRAVGAWFLPRNGCSTTTTSSRSRSARSATTCPPGYYRQLPKLAEGPFAGYPRVFGLAWAFVAHTDSHFDPDILRRFIAAYQRVQPLTIGELWAVAITLRIVLDREPAPAGGPDHDRTRCTRRCRCPRRPAPRVGMVPDPRSKRTSRRVHPDRCPSSSPHSSRSG